MWVFSFSFFPFLLRPSDVKGGIVKVMDYPAMPMTTTSIYLSRSRLSEETASLYLWAAQRKE